MRHTSAPNVLALPEDPTRLRGLQGVTWSLVASALLLAGIGAVTVHSASYELASDYLPRQLLWIALGVAALLVGVLIDYRFLLRLATPIYGLGVLAVALILLFGHEAGGARSWIGLAGIGGQPSDYAKLATAFFLARFFAGVRQPFLDLKHLVLAAGIVAAPMALIVPQPDLGGAVMFLPLLIGMALVAGVRAHVLVRAAVVLVLLAAIAFAFGLQGYQRERILSFVSPERDPLGAGYQVRQSKIAVGSGALLGKGYLQGTQSQLRFLPARHTDFVFAVLAEERGFVGVMAVLALYAWFLASGVRVAMRARDRAGILLAVGLLSVLSVHVLYNTAMMIGLVPVTGIPLPFLSYGGSFTLFCFFSTGVILGIDSRRYVNR